MNPPDPLTPSAPGTSPCGQLLDLRVLRLERAIRRLQAADRAGALADLRVALRHMQRAGAYPLSVHHLSAIIHETERAAG
jgi:hypothetical protein